MKIRRAENFMRSTMAPMISAGVMMAKVIWKAKKTSSGMVPVQAVLGDAGKHRLAEAADVGLVFAAIGEGE